MDTPGPEGQGAQASGRSYWARWEYTPQEWRLFDQRDWRSAVRMFIRSMQDLMRFYLILAVFAICLFFIFMVTGRIPPASPVLFGIEALGIAGGMVLIIPVFAMTDLFQLLGAWKRHRARQKEPRQVIIGSLSSSGNQAIWIGEQYVPLQNFFLRLDLALLYEDIPNETDEQRYHPQLHFSRFLGPLNINSLAMICVLVPQGYEEEAKLLVERFNQETIPAKKSHRKSSQSA